MEYGKMLKKGFISIVMAMLLSSGLAFSSEKVNINTASSEQLQSIKGFGKATAKSIIEYREENGSFLTVADLVNVKGIGSKKLDKLSEQLSVSDPEE